MPLKPLRRRTSNTSIIKAYEILREFLFIRERLRPYIMRQMRLAAGKGTPPMRPLFYDYPDDLRTWEVEDQFLFGPDLLVAPVLHKGARKRGVYLPKGSKWTDAWTDKVYSGGKEVEADAPMSRIPLYVRAGKKLPIRGSARRSR